MICQSFYPGVLFLVSVIHAIDTESQQPLVEVEQGFLMGKTITFSENEYINIDKMVNVYEGVPYAEPPVRFEYPVKKTAWNGTWDATNIRATCYQESSQSYGLLISEDCLYLNIYLPQGITDAAVMVWFHGGGFTSGTGSHPGYNGVISVVGDVILVSVNYRVGAFGFLTTGDDALPGNYGLMDQVEALRWTQQNIHAFGGNKDKITIFGESAGATCVNFHILSKQSRGLFKQAIMQDGTAFAPWALQDVTTMKEAAFGVGAVLGCTVTDSTALRECLQQVTEKEFYDAANTLFPTAGGPIVDGFFLEDSPRNLMNRQDFQRTPILIGSNADEGTFNVLWQYLEELTPDAPPFVSKADFKKKFAQQENPLLEDLFSHQYLDWSIQDQENLNYFQPFVNLDTDVDVACPADIVARAHTAAGDAVYRYEMTHIPTVSFWAPVVSFKPVWMGASRAEELPFIFGFAFEENDDGSGLSGPEKVFSMQFMRFWAEFAKTGSPTLSDDPEDKMYWPRFTIPELKYKVLALNLTTGRALKANRCHFVNDIVPKLKTYAGKILAVEREWRSSYYNWKYQTMEEWQEDFNAYKDATQENCDAGGCE